MRIVLMAVLVVGLVGCSRYSLDSNLNDAYKAYDRDDCAAAILALSKAERSSRTRRYVQPEISMLRGQCLERQALYVDAIQTYQFILSQYPASEYAYRARARIDTLSQLGHAGAAVKVMPAKP
ncbi:tetratricopeptide repeat protein [Pseudomonas sp. 5P_3.1_Bac2]|uniref:tetratricopeptide repeat protein n=1 Tax=Pseudomonas sp. 5P_3.1_Bac2 TaxID=2971617 RepID=UPI0021C6E1FA|nr:tetratricopeptide repeat protein [Pseudomonas sp. 5P_3.1_Bac2]MCU1718840.1 tetratricopeptide repeat protein [Pseudomonas sp. 5P_3.1_Bac2]